MRSFRRDPDAVGQIVAFLVAGAIFLAVLGTVLLTTRDLAGNDLGSQEAGQDNSARSLADLLVSSQGIGWEQGPDGLDRLGFLTGNRSGLDPASMEALRGASFDSLPNGKVDYPDARTSLGLTATQDFHLRIYPTALPVVYEKYRAGIRTAYIGDWTSLLGMTVADGSDEQVKANAQARINTTMFANTALERQALRNLGLDYDDQVFISALSPTIVVDLQPPELDKQILQRLNVPLLEGDVYPDSKLYLDATLHDRLPGYDMLIVGSGVDQSALTSGATKFAVEDFVRGGGLLIVLGSEKMNYQWLQPLFSTGVRTVNGAASAPDPSHPLLSTPHELHWTLYEDHDLGWDIKSQGSGASYTHFSHVIVKGGEDVLAVSNDGAFGEGRIILTTYLTREIADELGVVEAEHFFDNLILFADRSDLYLEYGPEQPSDRAVAVATRQTHVWDPEFGLVPLQVELHLWDSTV